MRDFHKRPTLAELISAVKGERNANPKLRWLSQRGTTEGDSNQGFEKEMQKRIQGYGKNKNMVAWCVCPSVRALSLPCLAQNDVGVSSRVVVLFLIRSWCCGYCCW